MTDTLTAVIQLNELTEAELKENPLENREPCLKESTTGYQYLYIGTGVGKSAKELRVTYADNASNATQASSVFLQKGGKSVKIDETVVSIEKVDFSNGSLNTAASDATLSGFNINLRNKELTEGNIKNVVLTNTKKLTVDINSTDIVGTTLPQTGTEGQLFFLLAE